MTPADAQPLSRRQKARLCVLAARAHALVAAGSPLADWRRAEAVKACQHRISEATQADYLAIKAHFENLLGHPDRALNTLMREHTNGRRIAYHHLQQACQRGQLPLAYAAAICRRQFRVELDAATERQLWNLTYTLRNRAAARMRTR